MARVIIYTTRFCPYCYVAKGRLDELGLAYDEIDLSGDREMRRKLVELAGGRKSVPQIFIDGRSIGGYTDLEALLRSGELQRMLDAARR